MKEKTDFGGGHDKDNLLNNLDWLAHGGKPATSGRSVPGFKAQNTESYRFYGFI